MELEPLYAANLAADIYVNIWGQFSHCYIPQKLRISKIVSGSIFRNISGGFDLLSTIFQVLKITFYFPNGSFGSTPAKSAKTTNVSYELILNTQRII
jgi:hypothetical protein